MASARALTLAIGLWAYSATADVLPKPGQPSKSGTPLNFEIVGDSGVSAQQMFVGTPNKVYIIDKTENNPLKVAGHPAWATEYTLDTNQVRPMDVYSNSFCAGGSSLGNGTWLNVGGNQGITWGGNTPDPSQVGEAPYFDYDGGKSIRTLVPCDDGSCNWVDNPANYMSTRRWYPTLETLEDGRIIIIGGNLWGGFVNSQAQNNPTYEFYPSSGDPIGLNILRETLPANLFPLTWLLPSGNLLIQTNYGAEVFDYKKNTEYELDEMPHAVRTYPASGASVMLPLTPANNYMATILFCGGSNLQPDQWVVSWAIAAYPADGSCVTIKPDTDPKWRDDASLPEGRTMGNFVLLPNGKIFLVNGGNTGTAGYGNDSWAIGHSYADNPILTPLMYDPDPSVPTAQKFSRDGLKASVVPRLYHSSALLLADGSVLISGSNPNPDYTVGNNVKFPTEYRTERFYPAYYSNKRPEPAGLLSQLSYGGAYFNVTLTLDDLSGDVNNLNNTKVVVIRTGFSTHAINMGQRYVELNTTYTGNSDGTATLHVSQLPPNPAILAPGPAFIYVVVNGIPSVGQMIMVGSGKIAKQPTTLPADLPVSSVPPAANNGTDTGGGGGGSGDGGSKVKNSATSVAGVSRWHLGIVGLGLFVVSCL